MSVSLNLIEKQHLLKRTINGALMSDQSFDETSSAESLVALLFNTYTPYKEYNIVEAEISMELIGNKGKKSEDRMLARQRSRLQFKALNLKWLNDMMKAKNPLNERMAFFWHGHFACRSNNSFHIQQYLNMLRKHALGNFGTMLMEISKTPAMLSFLNNQQNKVDHPNENFAREVMELFTIGIGNYSEMDVKESARAFTGWSFNRVSDTFEFKDRWHDAGEKNFLGQKGNFKGEDIIEMLLKEKQTAYFITEKIWKFFVNENPKPENISKLAQTFYDSGYDISILLIDLFTSKSFFEKENIGALVKSPIDLIVGVTRQLDLKWLNANVLIRTQRLLGQVLMLPPNVAGWKGGKAWIDSSSLTLRMGLAHYLLEKNELRYQPKEEEEVFEMSKTEKKDTRKIVDSDWLKIEKYYKQAFHQKQLETIFLSYKSKQNNYYKLGLKDTILSIMTLPEYQLT